MGRRMQPIRDMKTMADIERTLAKLTTPRGRRMFLMWEVGTRMGFRVSDLLPLRVGDLRGQMRYTYLPKKQAHKKGARPITVTIEPGLRKILAKRCEGMDDRDWLFPSEQLSPGGNTVPISRQKAYLDMQEIARLCGIQEPMGCHTMRKTFGYHHYKKAHDVAFLQTWFYHSSPETTLIYIGIAEDEMRARTDHSPFSSGPELDDIL